MARRKSVGELVLDIKAKDRNASKNLDLVARRLRSLQTIGFTTAIGIAAATGTAAASIAAIGTAAVVAGAALAALGAFGLASLAGLAIASAAETEMIKQTWEKATEAMGAVWARVTVGWVDSVHEAIHQMVTGFEAMEPGLRVAMEAVRRLFDRFVDRVTDPTLTAAFASNMAASIRRTEQLWADLIDLIPVFGTSIMNMMTVVSQAFARNREGIVAFFSSLATSVIPSLTGLLNVLIDIFGQSGVAFNDFLVSILDGFAKVGKTIVENEFFNTLLEGLTNFMDSFFTVVDTLVQELGPGLGDVFTQLGKVLEAMEPLLSRFGHLFETIMVNLAAAIEKLSPHFGPLIDAFGGLMDAVTPLIAEILLDITDALIAITPQIIDIVERLTAWITENPELTKQLLMIAGAAWLFLPPLVNLVGAIGGFISILGGVGTALGIAAGPFLLIIAAVAAFVAALIWAWNNSEEFREVILAGFEHIKSGISEFWNLVSPIFKEFGEWWSQNGDKVMNFVGIVASSLAFIGGVFVRIILNVIGGVLRGLWEALTQTVETIMHWSDQFGNALEAVADFFQLSWEAILHWADMFGNALSAVGDFFSAAWEGIKQFFRDIDRTLTEMNQFFSDTWASVKEAVGSAIDWIADKWDSLKLAFQVGIAVMGEKFTEWKDNIVNAVTTVRDWFTEFFGEFINTWIENFKNNMTAAWEAVQAAAEFIWEGLLSAKEAFISLWERVKQFGMDVANALSVLRNKFQTAWDRIKFFVKQAVLGIIERWEELKEAFREGVEFLKNKFSEWRDKIFEIVNKVRDKFADFFGNFIDERVEDFRTAMDTIRSVMETAWNAVKDALRLARDKFVDAWNRIKQFGVDVGAAMASLRDKFSEIWSAIRTSVADAINGVKDKWDFLKNLFTNGIDLLKNKFSGWKDSVRGFLGDIGSIIGDVIDKFRDLPSDIISAIGNVSNLLWSIGRDILDGLIRGVDSMVDNVTDKFTNITNMIPDWKGPPAKDRTILVESGRMVMEGFEKGIEDKMRSVKGTFQAVGPALAQTPVNGPSSAGVGAGHGRPQVIVVELEGRQIMRAMGDHLTDSIRLRTGVRTA